jgi:hypothetical protein
MNSSNRFAVRPGETKQAYRVRVAAEMAELSRVQRKQISSGQIEVVMDVDDFGFLLPGYDDLLRLKKSLPGLRITCFTIPLPKEFYHNENSKQFSVSKYRKWAKLVNEQDWIEIAFHGFSHVHHELEATYEKTTQLIKATENLWNEIGLKYSKIYKAPYWQYSYDALVALRDMGYTIAIDRNHPRPVPDGAKTFVYNWSFEEPLPAAQPIAGATPQRFEPLKGHGHFVGNNSNNISTTLANVLHQIPGDATFLTIGEYLEKYGNET